ncbi:Glutarate-semialdehyde dehydrogenase [Paramyrothecium foliicola]|nr:Glutarate-semialdehyde dehydrogenase [Paramyrothecium foliicola]
MKAPSFLGTYHPVHRRWPEVSRKATWWLMLFELAGLIPCLVIFGIAQPDLYRTDLWRIGYDNKLNSNPSEIVYAYVNHRPLPNIPLVWSRTLTDFNVAISVVSLFFLLAKLIAFIMRGWFPILAILINIALVALYTVSVYGQIGPDYLDPRYPAPVAWYLRYGCDMARPYGVYKSCQIAQSSLGLSIYMLVLYLLNLGFTANAMRPNKANDLGDEDDDEYGPQKDFTTVEMHGLPSPTVGGAVPFTPRTQAFYTLDRTLPLRQAQAQAQSDPASGDLIGNCAEFDAQDTEVAIDAAADAFSSFRTTTGRERSKLLRKWYDLMVENSEDIAKLITLENGKPFADAKGEVTYAANFFEWFSEEAPRVYGDTIPSSIPGNRIVTLKEPVGVCGLITPWNFPAAMITRKIGPALAAGCTVVCKAPGETPYTSLALAELAHRAGIPKGVVNVVTSLENTPEVGKILTTSPIIKKVSFTGSTNVGKLLMQQSSGTLKKLSLELGGNAPFIVFDDADVDAAVAGAIASKFRSSGQTCVCANRIYVQEGIYDEFVQKFADKVKGFKVGKGFDEGTTHGPLIHERAVAKAQSHIDDAQKKGGKVLVGGQKLPDLGSNFLAPTVIRDMTGDMALASEETFGPVAGLFPFKTEKEVVDLANRAEVGLAGYFFSRDVERIYRVAESLEVGMVGVNTGLISDAAAPFGGVKESGFGREGSKYGISEYQIVKTITTWLQGPAPRQLAVPSRSSVRTAPIIAARCFSSSPSLYKKRGKVAPATNSSKPAGSDKNQQAASSGKGSGAEVDPLDTSPLTSAFTSVDAHHKEQLQTLLRGGRFNPNSLGALPVSVKDEADEAGGTRIFPLRELAQVVPRSGSRTVSLLLNDRAYIKPVMSAVQASPEYNQQPQRSEDNELELLLKVEAERADDLVRLVRENTQAWREQIRQARRKHDKVLKDAKKGGLLPDVLRAAEKEVQKIQDQKMKEIDDEEKKMVKQIGQRKA